MLVSKFFKLGRHQATLDFLDIHIDRDLTVFIDPSALRTLRSEWGHHCVSLLQTYFETVLAAMRRGDHTRAKDLLACLSERNEFHLGFSKRKSRGHALGPISAERIWESLVSSKAAKSGLLQDLEDTVLFVEGVGPDMLSDAVCNIIRGPLIKYTQQACSYYGIPLTEGVNSGPIWNPQLEKWEASLIDLPLTKHGSIILVPKVIVRASQTYGADEYYRHFLMPILQQHHKDINSRFVHVLRSKKNKGKKRVYKKDLYEEYGAGKLAAATLTVDHPGALTNYRETKKSQTTQPLDHIALSKLENTAPPDFELLIEEVKAVRPGKESANTYEVAIEKLLSAVLYPSLASPVKQDKIHDGRKRIDITYINEAKYGFFDWLARHHPASHVFFECKNYGKEVGNPELDQLSGRFSPSRGRVGILVVRSLQNRALFLKRCKDTAKDDRGFVLVLEDSDLERLVKDRGNILADGIGENLLYEQFKRLIS